MVLPLRGAHPPLALIVAAARGGVMGVDNRLPWRLPDDLRHFRRLTLGHSVIMGRRTWESLPGALADRQNIVVTRRVDFAAVGAERAGSLDDAIARVGRPGPAFCIGGAELFRAALPVASILYLTEIDADIAGDTWFPPVDRTAWRETARETHPAGEAGLPYAFVTYERP